MIRYLTFLFLSMVLFACEGDKTGGGLVEEAQSEQEQAFASLKGHEEVYIGTLTKADVLADSVFSKLERIEDTLTDPKYLTYEDIISNDQIDDLWAQAAGDPTIVQARVRIERDLDGTRFDFKLDPELLIGIEEEKRFDTLMYGIDLTGGYGVSTTDQKGLKDVKLVEIENVKADRVPGRNIYLRMFIAYEDRE